MIEKILSLMSRSDVHKTWTVEDIGRLIIPAIIHNKIRFFVVNGKTVGFVTFAFLSEEAEEGYVNKTRKLQPSDFKGEEGTLWFIDFIAPFGHVRPFIQELRKEFRPKYKIAKIKRATTGRIGYFYGNKDKNET